MRKATFYDLVRENVFDGSLDQGQVEGMEVLLDEGTQRGLPVEFVAYVLATTAWETNWTMQPVAEAYWIENAEEWRRKNLRYYPFYGRGDVQLTWKRNYKRMGKHINVPLVKDPDLAMEQKIAAEVIYEGMTKGMFTGKRLANYLSKDGRFNARKARRIVNGMDKAGKIANIHAEFMNALLQAEFDLEDEPVKAITQAKSPKNGKPIERSRTMQGLTLTAIGSTATTAKSFFGGLPYGEYVLVAAGAAVLTGLVMIAYARLDDGGYLPWSS